LWFRLNVVRVTLPPLCERRGDLPLLAHFFLKKYNERYKQQARITEAGLRAMEQYTCGKRAAVAAPDERLTILAPNGRIDEHAVDMAIEASEPREQAGETLGETEMDQIRRVLAATGGNKSRAAKILGIERKTLYRKLERMGWYNSR